MTQYRKQTVVASLALAVLVFVVLLTPHPPPQDTDRYASTDYRAAGYRAWAALLGREGVSTGRFVLRPVELDAQIDTLVSAPPDSGSRSPADLTALATWVRSGGRLVYIGRDAALSKPETDVLRLPYLLPKIGEAAPYSGPLARRLGGLKAGGDDRMLFIEHPGRSELADRYGDVVVRYALGRGEVVAVANPAMFTNRNLTAAGNARLAYLLATPRRPDGRVAFDDAVHGALIDRPWYQALPLGVRLSLALLVPVALVALVGGALRTGAPVPLRPPREPNSMEFIAALAALYERTRARAAAQAILSRDALAAAARAAGIGDRATPQQVAERLRDRPGGDAIERLVDGLDRPAATDAALLASAQLAHTIRKEWEHGGGDRRRAAFAGRARTRHRR